MDNTTTILSGLVGAGTLSAGVRSRALSIIYLFSEAFLEVLDAIFELASYNI